jgi:hypothetical protein
MPRLRSRKAIIAGAATAGVLGLGIAVPTVAFADGGSPSAAPSGSSSETQGGEQRKAARDTEFAKALAKELGIPEEKVTAALDKVREQHKPDKSRSDQEKGGVGTLKERLDQAVKDGKLTQEQADAVLKAAEAGVLARPGGPGHRAPGR